MAQMQLMQDDVEEDPGGVEDGSNNDAHPADSFAVPGSSGAMFQHTFEIPRHRLNSNHSLAD